MSWSDKTLQIYEEVRKNIFVIKDAQNINGEEPSFQAASPREAYRILIKNFHSAKGIRRLNKGEFQFDLNSNSPDEYLKINKIGPFKVEINYHHRLNRSRGVISHPDLIYYSIEEIKEELVNVGVIDVSRITVYKNGKASNTNSVILQFQRPSLPEYIILNYLKLTVRQYVPNPFRCTNCQDLGHTKNRCKGLPICGKCSDSNQTTDKCTAKHFHCPNCNGKHGAWDKDCPRFIREKKIVALMETEKLPYKAASAKIINETKITVDYAAVTKKSIKNLDTVIEDPKIQCLSKKIEELTQCVESIAGLINPLLEMFGKLKINSDNMNTSSIIVT